MFNQLYLEISTHNIIAYIALHINTCLLYEKGVICFNQIIFIIMHNKK